MLIVYGSFVKTLILFGYLLWGMCFCFKEGGAKRHTVLTD